MSTRKSLEDLYVYTMSKMTSRPSPLSAASEQAAEILARTPFKDFVGHLQAEEPELTGRPLDLLTWQVECFADAMENKGWKKKRLATESKISRRIVNKLFKDPPLGTRMKTLATLAVTLEAPLFEFGEVEDDEVDMALSSGDSDEVHEPAADANVDTSAHDEFEVADESEHAADDQDGDEIDRAASDDDDERAYEQTVDDEDGDEAAQTDDERMYESAADDRDRREADPTAASSDGEWVHEHAAGNSVDDEAGRAAADVEGEWEYEPVADESDGGEVDRAAASNHEANAYDTTYDNSASYEETSYDEADDVEPHEDEYGRVLSELVGENREFIVPEIVDPPPHNSLRQPPRPNVDVFELMRENKTLRATNVKLESTLQQQGRRLALVTDNRRRIEAGAVAGAVGGAGLGALGLELGGYEAPAVVTNVIASAALYGGGKLIEEISPATSSFARNAGTSMFTTTTMIMAGRKLRKAWQEWTSPRAEHNEPGERSSAAGSAQPSRHPSDPQPAKSPAPVSPASAPETESQVASEAPRSVPMREAKKPSTKRQVESVAIRRIDGIETDPLMKWLTRNQDETRGRARSETAATSGTTSPRSPDDWLTEILFPGEPSQPQHAAPANAASDQSTQPPSDDWLTEILTISPYDSTRGQPSPAPEPAPARVIQLDTPATSPRAAKPATDWLSELLTGV